MKVVLFSPVFLVVFSLALLLFITVRRLLSDYRQRRFRKKYLEIEPEFMEALFSPDPEAPLKFALRHRKNWKVIARLLLDYKQVVSGEAGERLRKIFLTVLKPRCYRLLASRLVSRRLQGVSLFFAFFEPEDVKTFQKIINDQPVIRLAALTVLARTSDEKAIRIIFQAFEQDEVSRAPSYFYIMSALGEKAEPYLRESMRKPLPPEKIALLVELAGKIPLRTLARELKALADSPDKEIRIRVARALGRMADPDSLSTLLRLAADEAWEVQAQAVRSLASFKTPEALQVCYRGLFSPSWHVRHNSARALAALGEQGLEKLREATVQNEDAYARDMATMILDEMSIFGQGEQGAQK